jgi:phosphoribosylanthranilate isomerase
MGRQRGGVVATKDYVGVCGVASVEEAKDVRALVRKSGFTMETEHVPMMGFQVSWKSLAFGFSEGNRRVPKIKELPAILEVVRAEVFPTIHYYTKNRERLVDEISSVLDMEEIYKRKLVEGVQINLVWPSQEEVKAIKEKYPELKIILSVSPKTTEGMTMNQVAERLVAGYSNVDYLILDASGGRGIVFDPSEMIKTYATLKDHGVTSKIVFSGGLGGDNVKERLALLENAAGTKKFSIDAEGGLRDKIMIDGKPAEGYGADTLSFAKVEAYLKGASEMLLRK